MIAVVIPLYPLNVCRGRARARHRDLQLALTIGIMGAMGVGALFSAHRRRCGLDRPGALAAARDLAWR